ncbi:hypothetical protein [Lysobacter capsici]|uniref:hypothetical protein n=1 Tax=Lysobacter capsici TaxID=435897 RepID=UPI0012FE6704|nr:hypothetical protein [Lysobacter capsici]
MDTAEHYTEAFAHAACAMPTVADREGGKTRDPRSIRAPANALIEPRAGKPNAAWIARDPA